MQGYNTRQKQLVADFFETNRGREFTVAEAAESLIGEVGFSSIYRIISSLEAEGSLKKFYREGNKKAAVYRYFNSKVCKKHLHLKCIKCGIVSHLSEQDTQSIIKIIGEGFSLSNEQTTIYGTCNGCNRGKL